MIEKTGPTIYKGESIYNTGAGGGGGGGGQILPDGIEEVESVEVVNANCSVNFGGTLTYTDTTFELICKIGNIPNSPASVLYNRDGSNAVGVGGNGRLWVYIEWKSLYFPTNDYFTLTEKNGVINGNSVGAAADMSSIILFSPAGYQTYGKFKGRFKRFVIYKENPNAKFCDIIPIIDKIENKYGIYDIINGVKYTNGFAE